MSTINSHHNQPHKLLPSMKHFSERLKAARKMNGFSLQDLSDAIGNRLNKQLIQRLETGEAKPDSEIISLLGNALKVTSDYFFRDATGYM